MDEIDYQSILQSMIKNDTKYVCKSSLLAGIPIDISENKRLQCNIWKNKAIEIEKCRTNRKQEKHRNLLKACDRVSKRMYEKEKNKTTLKSCFDENQNVYKSDTISTEHFEDTKQEPEDCDDEKLTRHHESGFVPEVEEQILELLDLRTQQEELDNWYDDMQRQLDLEKVKLAQKYDELKLQNIQKQKSIIENSEDFLRSSLHRQCTPQKDNSVSIFSPVVEACSMVQEEQEEEEEARGEREQDVGCATGYESDNDINLPEKDKSLLVQFQEHNESNFNHHSNLGKSTGSIGENNIITKTKTTKKVEIYNENVFEGNHDNGNAVSSKALASELLLRHYHSVDLKLRRKSKATKFFGSPGKKEKQLIESTIASPQLSLGNRNDESDTITRSADPLTFDKELPTLSMKEAQHDNELALVGQPVFSMKETHQDQPASVDPPISFTKDVQHDRINSLLHTPANLSGHQSVLSKVTSTPHDVDSDTPHYSLSHIYDDEIPVLDFHNEISLTQEKTNTKEKQTKSNPVHNKSKARLFAAYEGFMVRRLLCTYKAREILKTIKDTQMFLLDMDKENGPGTKEHKTMSLADRQLRTRMTDELSTKRGKLADIFLMSKKDQWHLIKNDRLHQEEKRVNAVTKSTSKKVDKEKHRMVSKKLSTASQKSMKRRQESNVVKQTRPKTAPEKISSKPPAPAPAPVTAPAPAPVKNVNEARALKPIQSSSSPTLKRRTVGNVLLNSLKKTATDKKKKTGRVSSAQI